MEKLFLLFLALNGREIIKYTWHLFQANADKEELREKFLLYVLAATKKIEGRNWIIKNLRAKDAENHNFMPIVVYILINL